MNPAANPKPATTTEPACVINCAVYRDGRRQDITLDQISEVLAVDDGSFVWVGLYEPGAELLDKLQEEFGLHDLAIEDAHNAHQRPKIEAFGNTMFIAVHTAQLIDEHVRFGETHIFLGERFLVTVRHGASLTFAVVREKLEREPEILAIGPAAALHGILDFIVDNYEPIVNDFQEELAVSVNLSLVNYAQGEVVKKLAGWAALLALPTLVASWYGMNFTHMPELARPYAYPVLIGVVLVACVLLYRYLKKVRWL